MRLSSPFAAALEWASKTRKRGNDDDDDDLNGSVSHNDYDTVSFVNQKRPKERERGIHILLFSENKLKVEVSWLVR